MDIYLGQISCAIVGTRRACFYAIHIVNAFVCDLGSSIDAWPSSARSTALLDDFLPH